VTRGIVQRRDELFWNTWFCCRRFIKKRNVFLTVLQAGKSKIKTWAHREGFCFIFPLWKAEGQEGNQTGYIPELLYNAWH
jgi:hypothetical protein